jgi:hypothetical protein
MSTDTEEWDDCARPVTQPHPQQNHFPLPSFSLETITITSPTALTPVGTWVQREMDMEERRQKQRQERDREAAESRRVFFPSEEARMQWSLRVSNDWQLRGQLMYLEFILSMRPYRWVWHRRVQFAARHPSFQGFSRCVNFHTEILTLHLIWLASIPL